MKPLVELEREVNELIREEKKKRYEYFKDVFEEVLQAYPEIKRKEIEIRYEEKAPKPIELIIDVKSNENKYDLTVKLQANKDWYPKYDRDEKKAGIARELETYLRIRKNPNKRRIDRMLEWEEKVDYYDSFIGDFVATFGKKAKEAKKLRWWKFVVEAYTDLKVAKRGFGKGLLNIIPDKKRKKLIKEYLKHNE